jgi:hypothetical protein
MKFDDMVTFENCLDDTIDVEGDEVYKYSIEYRCSVCGEPTYWVSISFCAHYCSTECLHKEWEGYFKADMESR